VVCVDISHLRGLAQQAVGQLAFGQFQQSFFARDYRTDLPEFLPYQLYAYTPMNLRALLEIPRMR
jgi:hypothetical protein